MKITRTIFTILSIIWMIAVFCFSNQPSDESKDTSSTVTQKIVHILYGDKFTEDELELKINELDPIIRKIAHYTLYAFGGILITIAIITYNLGTKKTIIVSQFIGTFYAITDEVHQYFVPRKKCENFRCVNRLSWSANSHNISIDFA